jgi:AraC-like DNA-binding protein
MHRHRDFQLVWIAKGKGVHIVEQKKYSYHDGSLFLLAPHFLHQIEYNDGVEGYVVSFSDTFLDSNQSKSTLQFYQHKECLINIDIADQLQMNIEFASLYHYYNKGIESECNSILKDYLHIILTKISRYRRNEISTNSNNSINLLERFIKLVREHYKTQRNLQFYHDKLAVSQRKLNDAIGHTTGLSPAKFMEQYSLNEAARMLLYSNYSIKEIAAELGYFDNSYFSKAFKKYFGKSPLQYRKEHS